jgi:hypothetical protein
VQTSFCHLSSSGTSCLFPHSFVTCHSTDICKNYTSRISLFNFKFFLSVSSGKLSFISTGKYLVLVKQLIICKQKYLVLFMKTSTYSMKLAVIILAMLPTALVTASPLPPFVINRGLNDAIAWGLSLCSFRSHLLEIFATGLLVITPI